MADALLCVWITEKHFVVCLHTHTAAEIQQEVQQFNKPNLLKSVSEMRLTDGRFELFVEFLRILWAHITVMLSFLLSFEPFSYILPLFFFFSLLHSLSPHYFICVPLFDLPMLIWMHAILYLSLSCTAVISHCELFTFTKVTTWRVFCLRSWWKFKTTPRSAPKDSPRHTSDGRLYISLLKHALHSGERAHSQNSVYVVAIEVI